jgi:thioredoxin reductase (NADPH)
MKASGEISTSVDRRIAFPRLNDSQLLAIRRWGEERATTAGDVLFAEGDRGIALFVVLEGSIEILEHSRGTPHTVAVHERGQFTGDPDTLSGRAVLVTGRVRSPGRVIAVSAESLRPLLDELPDVGEMILKAFLSRRTLLLGDGFEGLKIIGSRFDPGAHRLRDFATRNAIPFTWLDVERDENAELLLRRFGIPASAMPVVICRDGKWLSNPPVSVIGHHAGLDVTLEQGELHDLIVVGAGPAGLAASVYASSEGLRVLTIESVAAGGQAGTSARIENYLGFATGVSGAELTRQALLQAQKFGARVTIPRTVARLRLDGGYRVVVLDDGSELKARCVLVASGVDYRALDLPNFKTYEGAGIYYAATEMEARLCRGDEVVVVGGGNSAGQAVVYLSRYARHVHLVLRGDDLGKSMSRYLVDRVQSMDTVTIHRACSVSLLDGNGHVQRVGLRYADGQEVTIDSPALFMFIGATPRTTWLRDCVQLDRRGFVLTGGDLLPGTHDRDPWRAVGRAPMFLETSLPGIFAAGDVRSGSVKRVAAAVGEGSMAVSFVHSHVATPV